MDSTDWIGKKFGRLTVVAFDGIKRFPGGGKACMFTFECECGNRFSAQKSNIRKRTSCGCDKGNGRTAPKGGWHHPFYKTWSHMFDRCENPSNKSYPDYGARGISVCARWKAGEGDLTGFEAFVADMGDRPDGFTIERKDNSKGYGPGNCVWASRLTQGRNRRCVRQITIGDETKSVAEWCEDTGVKYYTAMMRIRRGWSERRAVTER